MTELILDFSVEVSGRFYLHSARVKAAKRDSDRSLPSTPRTSTLRDFNSQTCVFDQHALRYSLSKVFHAHS